jgi:hypothetical protein
MNKRIIIFLIVLINIVAHGQYNGDDFSISGYGLYTTSASLFLNPSAPDIVLRNESFTIEDILNPGIEIRYRVSDPLIIGLNVEYINISEKAQNLSGFLGNRVVKIEAEDGFILIPIELTAYYLLPFSTESFKFLMGGGFGYYNGEFLRKVSTTQVSNVSKETAFGIHVSISMEYIIIDNLLARIQMKFRDPEFTVSSKFDHQLVEYAGQPLRLPEDAFNTKINMDGLGFMFGLSLQF